MTHHTKHNIYMYETETQHSHLFYVSIPGDCEGYMRGQLTCIAAYLAMGFTCCIYYFWHDHDRQGLNIASHAEGTWQLWHEWITT